jgi:hypothetical protein
MLKEKIKNLRLAFLGTFMNGHEKRTWSTFREFKLARQEKTGPGPHFVILSWPEKTWPQKKNPATRRVHNSHLLIKIHFIFMQDHHSFHHFWKTHRRRDQ